MKVAEVVKDPVLATLLVIASAYGGFVSGQTKTTDQLEQLTKQAAALERRMDMIDALRSSRNKQYYCAVRTLDRLTEKAGIAPPCPLQEGEQ
jgi:hypothetical protein